MSQNTEQNVRTRDAAMIDQYVNGARFGWACGRANDFDALKEKIDQKQKDRFHPEARGAEEQRRKDADEHDVPSAWVRPDDFYNDEGDERFGPWTSEQIGEYTIPLYTRAINVAALEARVKVMEEYYEAAEAISFNASSEQCDRLDRARAALTREGGV